MLELKTKAALASEAFKLARGFNTVRHNNVTYIPADFETLDTSVQPKPKRTVWLPVSRANLRRIAAAQFNTLFSTDSELGSFEFMVSQVSTEVTTATKSLLVRTNSGLKQLTDEGKLVKADGTFHPNYLQPILNTDPAIKKALFKVFCEWLDSKEEATSMLHHLATALAPGWSAVKYILLLGEGRNGKGVTLQMMKDLFGSANCSNVTRQMMAENSPALLDLNGKLLNLVFDGPATYLKDSGTEKSLVAGEPVAVRRLYESSTTQVMTNALFVEGLNFEPKTRDKSTALQKRLVRFHYPNVYEDNLVFKHTMLAPETLGAFLALLIDHYVKDDELAVKLAPTARALELRVEQMYSNSQGLQFLKWFLTSSPLGINGLIGMSVDDLVTQFKSWRLSENDLGTWSAPDVLALFTPLVTTERKSVRVGTEVQKKRIITALKTEAIVFSKTLEGGDDLEALEAALVEG